MKNIICILFTCAPLIVPAQNVGVGTTSPLTKLHIHGSGGVDQMLRVNSTASFQNPGSPGVVGLQLTRTPFFGGGTDWMIVNEGPLRFVTDTDNFTGPGTERMRLTDDGALGIGITNPIRPLHLYRGSGINPTFRIEAGSPAIPGTADIELLRTAGTGDFVDWHIANTTDGSLRFEHYDGDATPVWTEDVRILSNGNVGIGATNPAAKLHIEGGEEVNYSSDGHLMLGVNTGANLIMDANEILARNNGAANPLYIQYDGGDLLLCALENGGVGIGVGAGNIPSGYLLAVDGKVISEEVRVELSGDWPDYVFADEYALMPIDELENSIKTNRHLPGIPSAAQVEAEGQMLGATQIRMLEKIEELTLYIIELHKEIELLKSKVNHE